MNNAKRPYEDYKKDVLNELKEFGNFTSPTEEAKAYLASEEVEERIKRGYYKGDTPGACAWAIDMLY